MLGRIVTLAAIALGGAIVSKKMKNRDRAGMSSIQESIEVDVPVSTAYNQWTQFEEFPRFMTSVQEVVQLDDTHLHWKASVAGKTKEWDVEITEQQPDRRIAWRSVGGVANSGQVSFEPLGSSRCRVILRMHYQPDDMVEMAGDAVGAVAIQAKQNLHRFKTLLEQRGSETGAWRGSVSAQGTARRTTH